MVLLIFRRDSSHRIRIFEAVSEVQVDLLQDCGVGFPLKITWDVFAETSVLPEEVLHVLESLMGSSMFDTGILW